jgi:pyruvate carboxylase
VAFPDSVADLFAGSLGTPPGGWPEKAQKILLRGRDPIQGRPGERLPPADFDAVQETLEKKSVNPVGRDDVLSYLLYPEVFEKFSDIRRDAGDVSVLPTPIFFYGMESGKEYTVDIEPGKTLVIRFLTVGDPHPDGTRTVFFELNGQPREVAVRDESLEVKERTHPKAEAGEPGHIGAPTPGLITGVYVQAGSEVKRNDKLLSLEAMKMQSTIYAPADGRIAKTLVEPGDQVEAKDLLLVLEIAE